MTSYRILGVALLVADLACTVQSKPIPAPSDSGLPPPPPTAPPDPSLTGTSCKEPRPTAAHVCIQDCGPPVVRDGDPPPAWRWLSPEEVKARDQFGCPKCLPSDAAVETPNGPVAVSILKVGDPIWSQDDSGRRIPASVTRVASQPIVGAHWFYEITLSDSRVLRASGAHPLGDGRMVSNLKIGDLVLGARIQTLRLERAEGATFDIRPSTSRGTYWVSGVLLGSTLDR